ncbi:hypothetical protein [Lentilactobacillus buchneri]|uniref:hypothetical protein n=1 Tax=Lentilactobacillus buchneri TaxID=1581 RepID=UPI0020BED29A|nr:hypothetical protein [Lentilactobacillus buchneri]
MKNLSLNELEHIEYKVIFDYFDCPLSFICDINNINYLFYYISDDTFFVTQLSKKIVNILDRDKNLGRLYRYLYKHRLLSVLEIDFDRGKTKYTSAEERDDLLKYLPKLNNQVNFDYKNNKPISATDSISKLLDFPLESSDLTVSITDSENSNAYSVKTIKKIIDIIENSFNGILQGENNELLNNTLQLTPFKVGCFELNFQVQSTGIDDSKIDFQQIFEMLYNITAVSERTNIASIRNDVNKAIFKNLKNAYDLVKSESLSLVISNSNKVSVPLRRSDIVENNIKHFDDELDSMSKLTKNKKNIYFEKSKFVTGSIIYNSVKFEHKGETIRARFCKDLFSKIRQNENALNLNKSVNIRAILETEIDSNNDLMNQKYEIVSFNYNDD